MSLFCYGDLRRIARRHAAGGASRLRRILLHREERLLSSGVALRLSTEDTRNVPLGTADIVAHGSDAIDGLFSRKQTGKANQAQETDPAVVMMIRHPVIGGCDYPIRPRPIVWCRLGGADERAEGESSKSYRRELSCFYKFHLSLNGRRRLDGCPKIQETRSAANLRLMGSRASAGPSPSKYGQPWRGLSHD